MPARSHSQPHKQAAGSRAPNHDRHVKRVQNGEPEQMAAKTASKPFAYLIADEEAEVMRTAPALAQAAAEAKALISAREEEHEDAQNHLSDVIGSFKRGNDTYSATDLAEARAAVERAALLAEGQKVNTNRLAKEVPNVDKSLSILVAEAMAKVIPYAAEVIASFLRPAATPENLSTGPVIVITQDAPAKERGGQLGAGLTIRSFRLPHFQQIDKRDLEEDFKARGWFIPGDRIYQNTERGDGFMVDVVKVQELVAYASTPVVTKDPSESDVNPVIGTLSTEMVKAFPVQGDMMAGVSFQPGNGANSVGMSAKPQARRFKATKNGTERRTVVEVEYEISGNIPNATEGAVLRAATDGVKTLSGKFFPGVGVVDKVSMFATKVDSPRYLGVRVELVSKSA
ncbi:hypothetical protein ACFWC5_01215 [Streptomyces sp. NPDC060085]|uniref:hypothetical protein n=1 Tax=Streptomyces sp. NPDC060085 TaxID=3347054 RepID=UPI003659EF3D